MSRRPTSVRTRSLSRASRRRPMAVRGVTLIELMIGLVLGLATTIVISQVMTASEQHRRGTTSGTDAQVTGAVALYNLQREIMNAGYGMSDRRSHFGCAINAQFDGVDVPLTLEPLRIVDGGNAGQSDVLSVNSSSKFGFSAPLLADPQLADQNQFSVSTVIGVAPGDALIAVPRDVGSFPCSMVVATTAGGGGVRHDTGIPNVPSGWNNRAGSGVVPLYTAGSVLLNLGPTSFRTFSVSAANTLSETMLDIGSGRMTAPTDLYPNVVNMQAFYGKDTDNNGTVDVYNAVQPANGNEWQQVRTMRIVLVARTEQWQKDGGTTTPPVLKLGAVPNVVGSGVTSCGSNLCLSLKVDHVPDWQKYRYQVFDTVVPLRNLVWNR